MMESSEYDNTTFIMIIDIWFNRKLSIVGENVFIYLAYSDTRVNKNKLFSKY